jgi:hypothetical protein
MRVRQCGQAPTEDPRIAVVSGPPAHNRDVYVYEFRDEGGAQQAVSILGPDVVFGHGLCPEAVLGLLVGEGGPAITPDRFKQNSVFVEFLAGLIGQHIFDVPDLIRSAEQQVDGHVYVLDGRTRTPAGAVPPADLIGAVAVQAGRLEPGSYQHNPNHRLLTADGFFVLPDEIEAVLGRALRDRCTGT